jgi:hypothetical protein
LLSKTTYIYTLISRTTARCVGSEVPDIMPPSHTSW